MIFWVLSSENRGLRKQALQIEKSKDGPSKEQLEILREYTKKPRDEQEQYRKESSKRTSFLA